MRRFSWVEVSGEKDCIQCAVLGEITRLYRTLTLIQGNDAAVKFECQTCGFKAVGVVSVDGSEPEVNAPSNRYPGDRIRSAPKEEARYNTPNLDDPFESLPPAEEPYVPPKTDAEAIERAYGNIVDADEFVSIIQSGYDDSVKSGDWQAVRKITVTPFSMGSEKTVDVLVEFWHDNDVVYSCVHSSLAGVPDFEELKDDLRKKCRFAILGPRNAPAVPLVRHQPRGPVAVVSNGWGANATVADEPVDSEDARTREALTARLRTGI